MIMIYKIYEGLSGYLIAPDGTAVDKVSGQAIPFNKTNTGFQAKLTTDEQIGLIQGKRKPLTLVRRFTREDLLKMYEKSKNMFNDIGAEVAFTKKIQEITKDQNLATEDVLKVRGVVGVQLDRAVNKGEKIPTLQLAEGDHVFVEEASQISQEQMDQLTKAKPSKAKVKITEGNPSPAKKVKATDKAKPEAMKIPFFRIDGVEYQSARSASKALGVAVNTVLKRAKSNKDGWFYIEK